MSAPSSRISTIKPISDLTILSQNTTRDPSRASTLPSTSQQSSSHIRALPHTVFPTAYNNSNPPSANTVDGNVFIGKEIIPVNYGDDTSPAIAISDCELVFYYASIYILRTHAALDAEDIRYAANYISSFYSHSCNPSRDNASSLTDNQLIMFLVYADQTGICKFALIFNEELDAAIKARDDATFKRILLGPKEMFVELYDNTFLSTEDRDFIIRLIARESFSLMSALELLKTKILDSRPEENDLDFSRDPNCYDRFAFLTSTCYEQVCIQDSQILEDDFARATMAKHEKTPQSVFTVDKSPSSETPQVYCFNTLDLIASVTENIPINPKTGEPFSDYSIKIINQRFTKEINMYRRYIQIKSGK